MRVVEIFDSIEGEGVGIGKLTTFVRLWGCNLNCSWCDTKYAHEMEELPSGMYAAHYNDMTIYEVFNKINQERVVFTGGEPLLQMDEIIELITILPVKEVWIETNGTIDFTPVKFMAHISMDVKTPSSGMKSNVKLVKKLDDRDQLKFVITGQEDLEYAIRVLLHAAPRCPIIFQPCWTLDIDYTHIHETCEWQEYVGDYKVLVQNMLGLGELKRQFDIRVLPQIHHIFWGNKRGI